MARLLVFTATLRAGLYISNEEKSEIIDQLGDISSSRTYMTLPVIKVFVEHFLSEEDQRDLIKTKFPMEMDRLDIDSLCVQILAAALVTASFLMSPVIEDMYGESVTVKLGLVFSSEKHIETFPFVELFV